MDDLVAPWLGIAATASVTTTNDDATDVYEWWQGDSGPV